MFGDVSVVDMFDGEPKAVVYDCHHFITTPPTDLSPFQHITRLIDSPVILRQTLQNLNRSFLAIDILPQWGQLMVQNFVQQYLLQHPSLREFTLFFIDGDTTDMTALCGARLRGCFSINNRVMFRTRLACARANDANIAYCQQKRLQYDRQGDFGVANLFATQTEQRLQLQTAFNRRLVLELQAENL